MLWRGLSFEEVRLQGYRELDQLHSILYSLYNTTIQNLYARLKAAAQQVECIILGELGENGTARHVASFLSSHGFDESPEDVAKRTVVSRCNWIGCTVLHHLLNADSSYLSC